MPPFSLEVVLKPLQVRWQNGYYSFHSLSPDTLSPHEYIVRGPRGASFQIPPLDRPCDPDIQKAKLPHAKAQRHIFVVSFT